MTHLKFVITYLTGNDYKNGDYKTHTNQAPKATDSLALYL